jgi:hypothetical protein
MRDEATLERHQELAMALAHSHAKDLGVPFVVVEARMNTIKSGAKPCTTDRGI